MRRLVAVVLAAVPCACTESHDPDFDAGVDGGGVPDAPPAIDGGVIDGGAFQCNNDAAIEPNNAIQKAFITPISTMSSFTLVGLALCPAGDVDHYRFDITSGTQNFEATARGVAGRTPVALSVLNAQGTTIATGSSVGATPQIVRVEIPSPIASGQYFVRVSSPDSSQNNYDLTLKVCSTPLPCP